MHLLENQSDGIEGALVMTRVAGFWTMLEFSCLDVSIPILMLEKDENCNIASNLHC